MNLNVDKKNKFNFIHIYMKKVALIILDGWGHGNDNESNAISQAKTPFIDSLYNASTNNELTTHGLDVGLPEGQMGNSEVGHMNIGAGRVVYQDLVKINQDIQEKKLEKNQNLIEAFYKAQRNNKTLHVMGLISDGGIHSHIKHLYEICDLGIKKGIENILIHGFTDGRDTDPKSGIKYITQLQNKYKNTAVKIASITGRYYAMDRDKRWERTAIAYHALTQGKGNLTQNICKEIEHNYNNNITDEFLKPIINTKNNQPIGVIKSGDIVLCFNFRKDRCRQITSALTQENFPKNNMKKIDLSYYTMTNYDKTFKNTHVLFQKETLKNTLGEIISKQGLTQLRIAETEKYPHVTYFFSGGQEEPFKKENRVLIPSPKVATYDLKPEMSAKELTQSCIEEIKNNKPDFICLNFANPDMVGHTGDFLAVKKALETVDECTNSLVNNMNEYNIIIIADHGNAEYMLNNDKSPNTAHTTNKVPIFLINSDYKKIRSGKLADIAPTILTLMNIEIPREMTGENLLT